MRFGSVAAARPTQGLAAQPSLHFAIIITPGARAKLRHRSAAPSQVENIVRDCEARQIGAARGGLGGGTAAEAQQAASEANGAAAPGTASAETAARPNAAEAGSTPDQQERHRYGAAAAASASAGEGCTMRTLAERLRPLAGSPFVGAAAGGGGTETAGPAPPVPWGRFSLDPGFLAATGGVPPAPPAPAPEFALAGGSGGAGAATALPLKHPEHLVASTTTCGAAAAAAAAGSAMCAPRPAGLVAGAQQGGTTSGMMAGVQPY